MPFSEFLGNERIVTALGGALRSGRVPHAMLFSGPAGVGKFTLARLFAAAANCEKLTDDSCGECDTCKRISLLADPQRLIEQGLAERGESADAATVERIPLILQSHPDVWALVPDPVRLKNPVARPVLRIGQIRAAQRAAYFQPMARRRVFIFDGADTMRWEVQNVLLKILEEPPGTVTNPYCAVAVFFAADHFVSLHAVSLRAARDIGGGANPQRKIGQISVTNSPGSATL